MLDLRLRTKVSPEEMEFKVGKILGPEDYNLLLTGPARIRKPDGRPLCVYLPGVMREQMDDPAVYDVLHELRTQISNTRGKATGSPRVLHNQRRYSKPVPSVTVGAMDPQGQQKYCRLTAWTGKNLPQWETLHPVFREVAEQFSRHVPDRFATQAAHAKQVDPAWVIPGTPFSTITVNNTYPTGVHKDNGDLEAGFSTISCLRRGSYEGGQLVFPEYRVAVSLQHGDLLLMDAHDWHGNVAITCTCGNQLNGCCETCAAERVSVVSYFRAKLVRCGSPEEEYQRASAYRERTGGPKNANKEEESR